MVWRREDSPHVFCVLFLLAAVSSFWSRWGCWCCCFERWLSGLVVAPQIPIGNWDQNARCQECKCSCRTSGRSLWHLGSQWHCEFLPECRKVLTFYTQAAQPGTSNYMLGPPPAVGRTGFHSHRRLYNSIFAIIDRCLAAMCAAQPTLREDQLISTKKMRRVRIGVEKHPLDGSAKSVFSDFAWLAFTHWFLSF